MPQRISIRLGASKDGALAQRSSHITTLHCLCPAAGAASATESRSSARRIRCAAQLLSRFETDVRGGHAERSHFQLFLNRKLGAGGGVVVCVCRVGSHVSEEMWWRFELTVASFAVVLVLWQRGPPEHCKQYQIRVHKKIATCCDQSF